MNIRSIVAIAAGLVVALIGFTVILGSWYTIDQGERGVLLRNGAIIGTAQPGLGFKTPWIEDVVEVSVQSHSRLYENVLTYSKDQQTASLTLSINFRIPPDQVAAVYENYGDADGLLTRLVDRQVYEKAKTVFGRFSAVAAIQERARLNAEVMSAISDAVRGPVIIESVQVENIDFSDAYEASIEARMMAEVEVQKLHQNAEREKVQAEIVVTQAKGRADSQVAEAEAKAKSTRLAADAEAYSTRERGDAEAQAIEARGKALAMNPQLVDLVQAERWNGALPATMIPGAAVPFIGLK